MLRFEEEAAKVNGSCLGGGADDSSPSAAYSKIQLPQMHAFEPARQVPAYDEAAQYQYGAQSFGPNQPDSNAVAAAQLNQLAFAANNSQAGQYMTTPIVPTLTSFQPTSGMSGSRVEVRISAAAAPYDLVTAGCQFILAFGQHRCRAHLLAL